MINLKELPIEPLFSLWLICRVMIRRQIGKSEGL
jgi:hypothetical protein